MSVPDIPTGTKKPALYAARDPVFPKAVDGLRSMAAVHAAARVLAWLADFEDRLRRG